MTSVCVVIPVYRAHLSPHETVALRQCVKVLGRYPLTVLKPASLDLGTLRRDYPMLREESFEDRFFTGVSAYNTLMLSRAFYERFAAFEYLLIHQLDAFVFRDELAQWCARGFDYIGAPWLPDKLFRSRWDRARLLFKHSLGRLLRFDRFDRRPAHRVPLAFRVGNGGLSLRRVQALINVIDALPERIAACLGTEPPLHEDGFFAIEANRGAERLRLPDYRTAARFAVEQNPRESLAWLCRGELPFGCHGWDKIGVDYWRHIIDGYDPPPSTG